MARNYLEQHRITHQIEAGDYPMAETTQPMAFNGAESNGHSNVPLENVGPNGIISTHSENKTPSSTKEAKKKYLSCESPLTLPMLSAEITERQEEFSNIDNEISLVGTLQKTGVVGLNKDGSIAFVIKNPKYIPTEIDDKITFGAEQTADHVETSLMKAVDDEYVTEYAGKMIQAIKDAPDFSQIPTTFGGFGKFGSEPEGFAADEKGDLANIDGGELLKGTIEETVDPVSEPLAFFEARSEQIQKRKEKYPHVAIVDTSTPMTSTPEKMNICMEGDIGDYVKSMQDLLFREQADCLEPATQKMMENIAQQKGYANFEEMKAELGHLGYWAIAASHLNIGLPHHRDEKGRVFVTEQEVVAVTDVMNSDLATVAEMLMMSTPLVWETTPEVEMDGKKHRPRDVRALLRYTLNTGFPSGFIRTPEALRERITENIVNGPADRLDRASLVAEIDGKKYPVQHGRARARINTSKPEDKTGRIEYTGCSSSPSIMDEAARNSFLQLLAVGAYEALANGQQPIEYFKENYPHIATADKQKDLAIDASLHGFSDPEHPEVTEVIHESIRFINDMQDKYPALEMQCALARVRIQNLLEEPADSIEEYTMDPKGPISEVILKEYDRGVPPLEIVRKLEKMQIKNAEDIIKVKKAFESFAQAG